MRSTKQVKQKTVPCRYCPSYFTTKWGRQLHETKMHHKNPLPEDGNSYRESAARSKDEDDSGYTVKFCPCCGFNIDRLRIAEGE